MSIIEEFQQYPSVDKMVKRILIRRGGSLGTVKGYIYGIKYFIGFVNETKGLNLDPESAIKTFNEGKLDVLRLVDDFIDAYLENHSNKYVRSIFYGVKKWLEVNHVEVRWEDIDLPVATRIKEIDRAPNKEELRHVLEYGNVHVRDRATILIAVSSGLRVGTLRSLKLGDVDLNYSAPDVAKITVTVAKGRKIKRGRAYYTFITPEAKKSLKEYLGWRRRNGETLTEDSPLIGSLTDGGPIRDRSSYSRHWRRILQRAGKTEKSHRWNVIHFHTLRKFFRTQCEIAGVPRSFWDFWMGHNGGYLDNSYFRANEDEHIKEYGKAVPHLSVVTPQLEIEKQTRKMEGLEEVNRQLRERMETLKERLDTITESRRESDDVMDKLFEDPEFQKMIRNKIRKLKI